MERVESRHPGRLDRRDGEPPEVRVLPKERKVGHDRHTGRNIERKKEKKTEDPLLQWSEDQNDLTFIKTI